jgi:hypothetical protein
MASFYTACNEMRSSVEVFGCEYKCVWLQGYNLGDNLPDDLSGVGEKIVKGLTRLESPPIVARGAAAAARALDPALSEFGAAVAATEVAPRTLRMTLAFDERWGPTEWGPIPFLPPADMLVRNMEGAWGSLDKYRGLNSTSSGNLFVGGLQARFPASCSMASALPAWCYVFLLLSIIFAVMVMSFNTSHPGRCIVLLITNALHPIAFRCCGSDDFHATLHLW